MTIAYVDGDKIYGGQVDTWLLCERADALADNLWAEFVLHGVRSGLWSILPDSKVPLPCPLCGSQAAIVDADKSPVQIRCSDRDGECGIVLTFINEEHALQIWNRRR